MDVCSKCGNDVDSVPKSNDEPPHYLNGWIPVLESHRLKRGDVKPIKVCGNDLVAFRGSSGEAFVMDAYCAHLGANIGYGGTVM